MTSLNRMNTNSNHRWQACVDALSDQTLQRLAQWRGYSVDFCRKLKEYGLIGMSNGRIAFPITNDEGEVVGCHHRPLGGEGGWIVTWFVVSWSKLTPLVINEPLKKNTVCTLESQWDLFALLEKLDWHNGNASGFGFIATRGSGNALRALGYCRPDATILAFKQNDKAGEKWLSRLVRAAQIKVRLVVTPAPHKDLNDWTRSGATRADIETAISAAEVKKERPPEGEVEWFPGRDFATVAIANGETDLPYEGGRLSETTEDGRIFIRLPGENRLLSEFAADLGKALANTEIYNRNGLPFVIDHLTKNLKFMTAETFRTWVEDYLVCFDIDRPKDGQIFRIRRTMSVTEANTVLASPQFLKCLRCILRINQVSLPVLRMSGQIELLPAGFDEE